MKKKQRITWKKSNQAEDFKEGTMKKVTSITLFNDAVGKRLSATYSEIDDETGQILSDNKRIDRLITDATTIKKADALAQFAQDMIDAL